MNWNSIPGRDYQWSHNSGTSGVHTHEGHLVFWHRPAGAGGHLGEVARTQSFQDFITNGPAVPIPDTILAQLNQLLAT